MTTVDFGALANVRIPPLEAIRAELARRNPVWRPQPGPQTKAVISEADITGYGGAAGGGKTDFILGLALTEHRRSIIFRREHNEARDLFQRGMEILDTAEVEYKANRGLSTINLVQGDRQLEFGGIKNPDDWRKYRGRAKDGYFFDEGTEFEELMIRSLIGWNRTTIPGQRCRVALTFNPPTAKRGQWLISFFSPWLNPQHPNPAEYGELRWFTTVGAVDVECPNGEALAICKKCRGIDSCEHGETTRELCYPLSRTFIKATLDDNAFLKDSNYRRTLMGLPEPLRSQLLYGDFEAEEMDDPWQVIPTKWVQEAQERWLEQPRPDAPLSAIGADIARGGSDQTVFAPRIGGWYDYPKAFAGQDTTTGRIAMAKCIDVASSYRIVGRLVVGMDIIAVGSSPADVAEEMGVQLIPLNGSEREGIEEERDRATGTLAFINKRALWYWRLREALNPETGDNLALPPDRELLADLCAPHYSLTPRGIQIESKDDIKKRLGRSPDKGDAVVYSTAARPMVVGYQSVQQRHGQGSISAPMSSSWKSQKGF